MLILVGLISKDILYVKPNRCAIENGIADFNAFPIIKLTPAEMEEISFREVFILGNSYLFLAKMV